MEEIIDELRKIESLNREEKAETLKDELRAALNMHEKITHSSIEKIDDLIEGLFMTVIHSEKYSLVNKILSIKHYLKNHYSFEAGEKEIAALYEVQGKELEFIKNRKTNRYLAQVNYLLNFLLPEEFTCYVTKKERE